MITNNEVAWYQAGAGSVVRTLGNNHLTDNNSPAWVHSHRHPCNSEREKQSHRGAAGASRGVEWHFPSTHPTELAMVRRTVLRSAFAFAATLLLSATAQAQLFRAYLASDGSDANACILSAPCRLLPAALAAVADGGEIWMLDSANYNAATVTVGKSVSILAVPGAVGSVVAIGGPAISITASGLKVALRNLVVVPFPGGGGTNGIDMTGASTLTIEHSVIANLPSNAVRVVGAGKLKIANTIIRNNGLLPVRLGKRRDSRDFRDADVGERSRRPLGHWFHRDDGHDGYRERLGRLRGKRSHLRVHQHHRSRCAHRRDALHDRRCQYCSQQRNHRRRHGLALREQQHYREQHKRVESERHGLGHPDAGKQPHHRQHWRSRRFAHDGAAAIGLFPVHSPSELAMILRTVLRDQRRTRTQGFAVKR
jgi:hypothetical protein